MLVDIDAKDLKLLSGAFNMIGDSAKADKYRQLAKSCKDSKNAKFVCVKAKYDTKHTQKGGFCAAVSADSMMDAALQFASRGDVDVAKTLMLLAAMRGAK